MKKMTELYTKRDVEQWLRNIFVLCDPWDLEELLGYEPEDEDDEEEEDGLIDYAVARYIDVIYPKIFDHFELHPFMSGHDESGDEFFEHEYLLGKSLELGYCNWESSMDGASEYELNEVFYLVENGDVVRCMSFHFKSILVEFTHEYELNKLVEDDGYVLDAGDIVNLLNEIAYGSGR